jgi:hypothetical protein
MSRERVTILVAGENFADLEKIAIFLRAEGFKVQTVSDRTAIMMLARSETTDLILLRRLRLKQPATLRFEVFTCGAILGRSGHHLVLHMSKNWGGYSSRKFLFNNLLHWPPLTSPKFDLPKENAA